MFPGVVKNWRGVDGSMPTVESYPPLRSVPWRLDGAYLEGAKAETAAGVWMTQDATTATRNTCSNELKVTISGRRTRTLLRELITLCIISKQREVKVKGESGRTPRGGAMRQLVVFWCLYFLDFWHFIYF